MPFLVRVACDVGNGKLNSGIEFDAKPTVSELVKTVEALYTTELRVNRGDPAAKFRCVALMISRGNDWDEVIAQDQLENGAQLFAFDWTSPASSQGSIPPAQFVVTADQILKASRGPTVPPKIPAGVVRTQPAAAAAASMHTDTERAVDSPAANTPRAEPVPDLSWTLPRHASQARRQSSGTSTKLPGDAREYLFSQLCRASGVPSSSITAHRLHSIFVDYGLAFTTESFSEMIQGAKVLSRAEWATFEEEYGPVVDALYDRIATRSAMEAQRQASTDAAPRSASTVRDEILQVELEESKLMARQAALRQRSAELQRELREAESWEATQRHGGNQDDRSREWDTLQKFVALRRRQAQLRREEAQLNHELSLL